MRPLPPPILGSGDFGASESSSIGISVGKYTSTCRDLRVGRMSLCFRVYVHVKDKGSIQCYGPVKDLNPNPDPNHNPNIIPFNRNLVSPPGGFQDMGKSCVAGPSHYGSGSGCRYVVVQGTFEVCEKRVSVYRMAVAV